MIAIQVRIRVRALFNESKSDFSAYQGVEWEGTTGGTSQSAEEEVQGAIAAAGANAETGARIEIDDFYSHIEQPPVSAAISPVFNGHIPTLCWRTATTIPAYSLPDIVGGLPPYSVTATGLPAGVRLDGLTLTGSPYDAAPLGGVATFTLTDANGNTDIRMMDWVVAMGAPAGWSEIGGGFGTESKSFRDSVRADGQYPPDAIPDGGYQRRRHCGEYGERAGGHDLVQVPDDAAAYRAAARRGFARLRSRHQSRLGLSFQRYAGRLRNGRSRGAYRRRADRDLSLRRDDYDERGE